MKGYRDLTPQHLRTPIAWLAHAIRPYVSSPERGPTATALEIARNVAMVVIHGEPVAEALEEALRHRMRQQWIAVGDVGSAVWAGSVAWAKATGERRAA